MTAPRTVVAVSPHLDDAVFSVGGTLAALTSAGWSARVVTCFTATVPDPSPFALACQLDKGLPTDVDYMALRRAEDEAACAVLGAEPVHLALPEAPHRHYASPADLFAGVHADDPAIAALAPVLRPWLTGADLVLAPQALGGHVDHRIVTETVAVLAADALWWRDVPYVRRRPDERPWSAVPRGVDHPVDISAYLRRKATAATCYRSQLRFQFGAARRTAAVLREVATDEARRHGRRGAAEVLHGPAAPVGSPPGLLPVRS